MESYLNSLKSSWNEKLWIDKDQHMRDKRENCMYLCTSCKIEKNQHVLEIGAIIAGLILPAVKFLIVSCVEVYAMGMNNHRISNYPVI